MLNAFRGNGAQSLARAEVAIVVLDAEQGIALA